MSKITNDGLTRSGTGCFIAVSIWQQYVSGYSVGKRLHFVIFFQLNACYSRRQMINDCGI